MPDTFEVLEYERKPTRDGTKHYGRVRLRPGGWASSWSESDRKTLAENVGGHVTATLSEKDGYKNVDNVKPASAAAAAAFKPTGKDENIVRQSSWKSACSTADAIVAAMHAMEDASEAAPKRVSVITLFEYLEMLAHRIEKDVLAQDPPEPEPSDPTTPEGSEFAPDTGEDDIPF